MKNINQYFDYLYSLERSGMKYDLRNITKLLKVLGNPHRNFKSVHIAGTNGKGATASFIASILQEQGLKTGLFTSPHLLKFNERIRINGKMISDSYVKSFLDKNAVLIQKVKPSFFEVNTAMAFKYFAENKVECAVVECGLGGRLDSTNVIHPEVCVITQIGNDHSNFLGSSMQKIAAEKAGILKHGCDVLISDTNRQLRPYFKKTVTWQEKIFLEDYVRLEINGRSLSLQLRPLKDELKFTIPLSGSYQSRNAATALVASLMFAEKTGIELYIKNAAAGFTNVIKNTGYRGRLESITAAGRDYLFDVSHNPHGIAAALGELKPGRKDIIIFGIMADKDYKKAVKALMPYESKIIFTKPSYQRALEPETLYRTALNYEFKKSRISYTRGFYEALVRAGEEANGRIIITGSFFLVHDAIKALKLEKHFS